MKHIKNRDQFLIKNKLIVKTNEEASFQNDTKWDDTGVGKLFNSFFRLVKFAYKKSTMPIKALEKELNKSIIDSMPEDIKEIGPLKSMYSMVYRTANNILNREPNKDEVDNTIETLNENNVSLDDTLIDAKIKLEKVSEMFDKVSLDDLHGNTDDVDSEADVENEPKEEPKEVEDGEYIYKPDTTITYLNKDNMKKVAVVRDQTGASDESVLIMPSAFVLKSSIIDRGDGNPSKEFVSLEKNAIKNLFSIDIEKELLVENESMSILAKERAKNLKNSLISISKRISNKSIRNRLSTIINNIKSNMNNLTKDVIDRINKDFEEVKANAKSVYNISDSYSYIIEKTTYTLTEDVKDAMASVFTGDEIKKYEKESLISNADNKNMEKSYAEKLKEANFNPLNIVKIFNKARDKYTITRDHYEKNVIDRRKNRYESTKDDRYRNRKLFNQWNDGVLSLIGDEKYKKYFSTKQGKAVSEFIIDMLDDDKAFSSGHQSALIKKLFGIDVKIKNEFGTSSDSGSGSGIDSYGDGDKKSDIDKSISFKRVRGHDIKSGNAFKIVCNIKNKNTLGDSNILLKSDVSKDGLSTLYCYATKGVNNKIHYKVSDDNFIENYVKGYKKVYDGDAKMNIAGDFYLNDEKISEIVEGGNYKIMSHGLRNNNTLKFEMDILVKSIDLLYKDDKTISITSDGNVGYKDVIKNIKK